MKYYFITKTGNQLETPDYNALTPKRFAMLYSSREIKGWARDITGCLAVESPIMSTPESEGNMIRSALMWYIPSYDTERHEVYLTIDTKARDKRSIIRSFAKQFARRYLSTPSESEYILDVGLMWAEFPWGLVPVCAEDTRYFKHWVGKYAY